MNYTTSKLFAALAFSALLTSAGYADTLFSDTFDYPDGPLTGNGGWVRGTQSPSADDPSNHIVVKNGAVRFDWTATAPVNNLLRVVWGQGNSGNSMIYAKFNVNAAQAPKAARNVRPGFFSFGNFGRYIGSQQRGFVGIKAGNKPETFRLGISQESQAGSAFSFAPTDLPLSTNHNVMIGFDIATQTTKLWIGTTDPSSKPAVEIPGSGSNNGIGRANLRIYNSDGDNATTNLGIFEIDNLTITIKP